MIITIQNLSQMLRHARSRKGQNLQRQTDSKGDFRRCRRPFGMGIIGERQNLPMQIFKMCVAEYTGEKCRQRRRDLTHLHIYRQLTTAPEMCMGPVGMLGRLSRFLTSKIPSEHRAT